MTTQHHKRVRELFDAALDQPPEFRREFLAGACQGNQQLMDTVAKLLVARERSAGVLDTPVWQRREPAVNPGEPGSFIGAYKILRELGSGGMGVVYEAVRADEVFQRVCAVKVLRPELSTDWLLERFRQERQILARLDHINIARIVDGGSTKDGLPYFVMDFVDGPPINAFCSQHRLRTRQRLVMFQQVSSAVEYLHVNGVIHGDLKPPNILVGNDSLVKLVDFGIASALAASETREQSRTLPLMTPGYASPEQMRGNALLPASDVYSLGVILYELLTGARPFPVDDRSPSQLLNVITTQDPVPPSAALKTQNSPAAEEVRRALKGDLDSIVLRAIDREPANRYRSAAELSADIASYLDNRAVEARGGSSLYKSQKFFRRNWSAALATALIAFLLGTASWQSVELHKRYARSRELQNQVRTLQTQLNEALRKRESEQTHQASAGSKSSRLIPQELRENQLRDVGSLAEAYRTSLSESVRLWPGKSRSRQDLLDETDRYLHQAEPFVGDDPKAAEQLARAWLWLANIEGNPKRVNLHDQRSAEAGIGEAERLLERSPQAPTQLMREVEAAARQIRAGRN